MNNCEACGKPLPDTVKATAKYCDATCRMRAMRDRRRAEGLTARGKPRVTPADIMDATADQVVEVMADDTPTKLRVHPEHSKTVWSDSIKVTKKHIEAGYPFCWWDKNDGCEMGRGFWEDGVLYGPVNHKTKMKNPTIKTVKEICSMDDDSRDWELRVQS